MSLDDIGKARIETDRIYEDVIECFQQRQKFFARVGYVSQNVYLACANAGIGSRARGGWDQQKLIETLGIKPSLVVVLGQTVGYCK